MQILDSVVDGVLKLPDERDRKDCIYSVVVYLATGETPTGIRPVADAMMTSLLPVLNNSRTRAESGRAGGSKNGSKRKAKSEANGEANAKQTAEQNASGGGEREQADGEANGEANCPKNAKGIGIGIKPPQRACGGFKRAHGCDGGGPEDLDPLGEPRRGPSYAPPTPEEVAAYVAASGGFPIDAERFCGWYGDHGWPADDWRGTAMSWSRDERDRAAKRPREVSADDFAEYR